MGRRSNLDRALQPTTRLLSGLMAMSLLIGISWAKTSDSPVSDAAMVGDIESVRNLLEKGKDVNAAQGDGMTALHWAAENGPAKFARMLIFAGAGLEARTRLGSYTPLHLAAQAGQAELVEILLEAGSSHAAITTSGGATALHLAARAGRQKSVRALLDHDAEVNARESSWGQTPLMWAASSNQIEVLTILMERGADVALQTRTVSIPDLVKKGREEEKRRNQVLASFQGERKSRDPDWRPEPSQVQAAVRAALKVEVSKDTEATDEPIDFEERRPAPLTYGELVGHQGGLTALLHAAREGQTAAAMALIKGGADINQTSSGDHTSPLLLALLNGHFDLGLVLLQEGADAKAASDAGATPLYAALNTHWAPKARYPQQQAYQQQETSYLELMKALLERGADPNVRLKKHLWYMSYTFDLLGVNSQGATPFWRAAYATDLQAMKLLIAHGADPNIPSSKAPPRQRRRRPGQAEEKQEEKKPDPSGLPPVPINGPSIWPIHAASGVGYGEGYAGNAHRHVPNGWRPAVKFLVEELGADVNARDLNGYSPLHHAAARGDNELILYLVEKGADVTTISRKGETTVDMANGPVQRVQPFPETVALLEELGAKNNHNCKSC